MIARIVATMDLCGVKDEKGREVIPPFALTSGFARWALEQLDSAITILRLARPATLNLSTVSSRPDRRRQPVLYCDPNPVINVTYINLASVVDFLGFNKQPGSGGSGISRGPDRSEFHVNAERLLVCDRGHVNQTQASRVPRNFVSVGSPFGQLCDRL